MPDCENQPATSPTDSWWYSFGLHSVSVVMFFETIVLIRIGFSSFSVTKAAYLGYS